MTDRQFFLNRFGSSEIAEHDWRKQKHMLDAKVEKNK